MIGITLLIFISYLSGSLPTAVIISRSFYGFDIRDKGSGNMGSTNAFRVLGWKAGVLVQIVDIIKGVIPVLVLVPFIFNSDLNTLNIDFTDYKIIAGISAVAGHIWSFWVKFKGGKGINTATGVLLSLLPFDVLIAFSCFAITVIFTGFISLGSLVAAVVFPISVLFRNNISGVTGFDHLIYMVITVSLLVFYTHRKNISRLLKGNENRFEKLRLIKFKKKDG